MKLYHNPLSSYSQKALLAFYEKGIAFESELINLMDPESRAAYESINPLGKIPLLKPTPDYSVPESTSIIEYLEEKFPETPRLINISGEASRQVRFMDRMSDLYLNDPIINLLFMKFGFRQKNDEASAKAKKYVRLSYTHLNERLAKSSWLCGEQFSMADCAAIPALYYAPDVIPFGEFPAIQAYWLRAKQRPSVAKVLEQCTPLWENVKARSNTAQDAE